MKSCDNQPKARLTNRGVGSIHGRLCGTQRKISLQKHHYKDTKTLLWKDVYNVLQCVLSHIHKFI